MSNRKSKIENPTSSMLRQVVEWLACLSLAVVLFRAFEVESYMISTGSMAPSLFGYHKRIICPTCGHRFAVGVAEPGGAWSADGRSSVDTDKNDRRTTDDGQSVVCPNCGQSGIDISRVPRNEGDQLLVHKHAFAYRPPRRWEIAVFRNPNRPTQAYVKRIVGLPDEAVQIVDGDVYADGRICRKNLARQRAVRILVHDHDHEPRDDPHWQPRWVADDSDVWSDVSSADVGSAIDATPRREISNPDSHSEDRWAWLRYRHWIRAGGTHETSVRLDRLPADAALPDTPFRPVEYDAEAGRLRCLGVLSGMWIRRLLELSDDPDFVAAVHRLAAESHVAPITDDYGYDRSRGGSPPVRVRDLMISSHVKLGPERGAFAVEMADGQQRFQCLFDRERGRAILEIGGENRPARSAALPNETNDEDGFLLEMSTFDRQVLVAIDGRLLFEPLPLSRRQKAVGSRPSRDHRFSLDGRLSTADSQPTTHHQPPVRFGVCGLSVRVDSLKLFRDVHYTRGAARHGVDAPCVLGADEFFALGDNSPVSFDSRSWPRAAVSRRMLLGKPFLIHLPSRPGRLHLGSHVAHIRVPDFSRMRYIR